MTRPRRFGFARIQETSPSGVEVKLSNKRDREIDINDKRAGGRGNLELRADGGMKTERGRVAVPGKYIRVNGRGVPPNLQPRDLPNSFRQGDTVLPAHWRAEEEGRAT
jgi:hypothetical protein